MSTSKKQIFDITNEYIRKVDEIMCPLRTRRKRFIIGIKRIVRNLIIIKGIK